MGRQLPRPWKASRLQSKILGTGWRQLALLSSVYRCSMDPPFIELSTGSFHDPGKRAAESPDGKGAQSMNSHHRLLIDQQVVLKASAFASTMSRSHKVPTSLVPNCSSSVDSRYKPDRFRPRVRIGARVLNFSASTVPSIPSSRPYPSYTRFISAFSSQWAVPVIGALELSGHYPFPCWLDIHLPGNYETSSNACLTLSCGII